MVQASLCLFKGEIKDLIPDKPAARKKKKTANTVINTSDDEIDLDAPADDVDDDVAHPSSFWLDEDVEKQTEDERFIQEALEEDEDEEAPQLTGGDEHTHVKAVLTKVSKYRTVCIDTITVSSFSKAPSF